MREANGYLCSEVADREIITRVPRAQFEAAVAKVDKARATSSIATSAALDATGRAPLDLEIRTQR